MIHNIYPNPTNSSIIISFSTMKKNSLSKISIYDLFGNLISNTSTYTTNMPFKYVWNGLNYEGEIVPSGTYFVSILQGNHRDTRKLTIVK